MPVQPHCHWPALPATAVAVPALHSEAAAGALALATLTCNLLPVNAYHALTLQQWDQGAWRNFNGLMRVFALGWPYAAMVVVLLRLFPRSAPVPAPAA